MTKQYFGTDGIRGKVGEYPITAEFMLRLGWAAGRVFSREARGTIVIGKDTRVSGYMFESALEAGLVSAGIDVLLLGLARCLFRSLELFFILFVRLVRLSSANLVHLLELIKRTLVLVELVIVQVHDVGGDAG